MKMAAFGHYGLAIAATPTEESEGLQLRQAQTSAATQSATSSSSSSSSGSGIGPGAIAGAAVGCLVGGLLLGFLGAWIFLKKRIGSSSAKQSYERSTTTREPDRKSYNAIPAASSAVAGFTSESADMQLDQFLLDGTSDEEISSELQSLSDLIYQHVENNYELRPIQVSVSNLSRSLQALGIVSSARLDPDTIAACCLDPKTRHSGLRNVISTVLFRSIDVHSRSPLSMLPAPVAAFLQSSTAPDPHGSSQSAITQALSKWRRLSAYLLHPHANERTPLPLSEAVVASQASALAGALNTFLDHFAPLSEAGQRDQGEHLQAVIVECTKLGHVLFSHPSDWQFVYVADSQGAIVVCAGLEKLSQRDGMQYPKAKRVVAPVTVPS